MEVNIEQEEGESKQKSKLRQHLQNTKLQKEQEEVKENKNYDLVS